MEIVFNPKNIPPGHALAIGNFDGFHLGHKGIIRKMLDVSRENGLIPAVITFEPHPINVFKPHSAPLRINDLHGKMLMLSEAGVKVCYILKFDVRFSKMHFRGFIERFMGGNRVVTGFNFAFGHNREGSANTLKETLKDYYTQVAPVEEAGSVYSSSMVRMAITSGEVLMANKLLGHNYFIESRVIQGDKRARQMGFPTANIKLKPSLLKPKYGVYAVNTNYGKGIANFGVRPTAGGKRELLEVHLFDFNGNLYGQKLRVEFLSFIREEKAYNDFSELKKQIEIDVERVKNL